jgi:hypothetical protein
MAALALTASADLLRRLPAEATVTVSIVAPTATRNDDGSWTVTVYAREDQIPALTGLGYVVRIVTTDARLLARWREIEIDDGPGIS